MNFTNVLLVFLLAAHLPPGTTKTLTGLVGVVMVSIVAVRGAWGGLVDLSDAYTARQRRFK